MRTYGKALFLLAMMSTATHAGALQDKTDRFTGTRSVAWNSIPEHEHEFAVTAFAFYPKGASAPSAYNISLTTYSDSGELMNCHHSSWLIDGQPAPELEGKYEYDPASNVVIERLSADISRQTLERVAEAKSVEFKVCYTEGALSQDELVGIRKVLEATR